MGEPLRTGLRMGNALRHFPWIGLLLAAVLVWTHFRFERYIYAAGIDWSVQLAFFAALGLLLPALSGPTQKIQPASAWLLRWGGGLILATLIFMLGFFRYWQGDAIRWVFSDNPGRSWLFGAWLAFFLAAGLAAVLIPHFAGREHGRRDRWLLPLKLASLLIPVWAAALISDFLYPGTVMTDNRSGFYRDDAYFISGMILPVLDWLLWSAWCVRLAFAGSGSGRKAITALGAYGLAVGLLTLAPASFIPAIFMPFYVGVTPLFAVPLFVGAEIWRRRLSKRNAP